MNMIARLSTPHWIQEKSFCSFFSSKVASPEILNWGFDYKETDKLFDVHIQCGKKRKSQNLKTLFSLI